MLLRNVARRLIVVKDENGKDVEIKPGDNPAVEISDAHVKSDKFIGLLIKDGQLRQDVAPIVFNDEPDADGDSDNSNELAELQAEAITLGMEIKDTWVLSTLKGKIREFKKNAQ